MSHIRRAAAASLLIVALAACSTDEPAVAPSPSQASAAPPAPSATPSPSPSPSPEGPVRPTAAPETTVDAGVVANGASASVSGEGPAEIVFERDGEFAVVVKLDCSQCADGVVLTEEGRVSPYGESMGALEADYLMDVFEGSEPEQSLWLEASGPWAVTLMSWNDLEPMTGAVSGEGSTVLLLAGDSSNLTVTWEPGDGATSFQGRFFGASREAALVFGDTEAFSDEFELDRPGVLAITTVGEWSIEP